MPHKHKRQRRDDGAAFDLPPTSVVKALPTFQKAPKKANAPSADKKLDPKPVKSKNKAKLQAPVDDTPKSFTRLMKFHTLDKRLPKSLDDGTDASSNKTKKRKRDASNNPSATATTITTAAVPAPAPLEETQLVPKIQPGERLSDFAARVDQALPIAGLRGTDKQRAARVPGLKERTTKHNKRLERMQAEWREAERRRKEKQEEEMEELEEEREEEGLLWNGVGGKKKKKKKGKRGNVGAGPDADEDEDPWKALEKSRADARQRNLQDVVQAPPQLKAVRSRFKEVAGGGVGVDVGNVPGSVGSLRKREEMGQARRKVIEGYRKRMGRG